MYFFVVIAAQHNLANSEFLFDIHYSKSCQKKFRSYIHKWESVTRENPRKQLLSPRRRDTAFLYHIIRYCRPMKAAMNVIVDSCQSRDHQDLVDQS